MSNTKQNIVEMVPVSSWVSRWPQVRLDQFAEIGKMDVTVMDCLNLLAEKVMNEYGWMYTINSTYRPGDTGQHGFGKAIDLVFYEKKPGDILVVDQFLAAWKFSKFRRIGMYPFWNTPGLHGDVKDETLYWWQDKAGKYHYGRTPGEILRWKMVA